MHPVEVAEEFAGALGNCSDVVVLKGERNNQAAYPELTSPTTDASCGAALTHASFVNGKVIEFIENQAQGPFTPVQVDWAAALQRLATLMDDPEVAQRDVSDVHSYTGLTKSEIDEARERIKESVEQEANNTLNIPGAYEPHPWQGGERHFRFSQRRESAATEDPFVTAPATRHAPEERRDSVFSVEIQVERETRTVQGDERLSHATDEVPVETLYSSAPANSALTSAILNKVSASLEAAAMDDQPWQPDVDLRLAPNGTPPVGC